MKYDKHFRDYDQYDNLVIRSCDYMKYIFEVVTFEFMLSLIFDVVMISL